MSIERLVRRNTKIILGGVVAILALTMTFAWGPSPLDQEQNSGDALVMFGDIVISNKDHQFHISKARDAVAKVRVRLVGFELRGRVARIARSH